VEFVTYSKRDPDKSKGATETDGREVPGNVGMEEQLGHRDQDPLIKDADSDFPEPGSNPEHSGEPEERKKTA
jgi:hypothetical protein